MLQPGWMGAPAHLPACLCGVLTSFFASSCAEKQTAAAFCRNEPSRARGGDSAAASILLRCEQG